MSVKVFVVVVLVVREVVSVPDKVSVPVLVTVHVGFMSVHVLVWLGVNDGVLVDVCKVAVWVSVNVLVVVLVFASSLGVAVRVSDLVVVVVVVAASALGVAVRESVLVVVVVVVDASALGVAVRDKVLVVVVVVVAACALGVAVRESVKVFVNPTVNVAPMPSAVLATNTSPSSKSSSVNEAAVLTVVVWASLVGPVIRADRYAAADVGEPSCSDGVPVTPQPLA